jgi:hypothetical protein
MNSADEYVEIDKQEFPDHVPRAGVDILLRKNQANYVAEDRTWFLIGDCEPIAHETWDGYKWVCQRKDLPTTTPAESAPVFPLIDRSKHSQADIETALVYMIAEHLGMVTTRVTRADVEAVITEALEDKAEN